MGRDKNMARTHELYPTLRKKATDTYNQRLSQAGLDPQNVIGKKFLFYEHEKEAEKGGGAIRISRIFAGEILSLILDLQNFSIKLYISPPQIRYLEHAGLKHLEWDGCSWNAVLEPYMSLSPQSKNGELVIL